MKMRPATLKRFLRQENFADHLALHRADCLSSHEDLSLYDFCLEQLEHLREEGLRPTVLLSGRDLISMGFEPGPLLGTILRAVEDQQLEGRLRTAEEARAFVTARWRPGSDA
jgi:poly(A) polymerase